MLANKMRHALVKAAHPVFIRCAATVSSRYFSSATSKKEEDAATPRFADFTQKIDEATLRPPTIEDNEIKLDSKRNAYVMM